MVLSYDGRLMCDALVPSERMVTPREKTDGRVLLSKEKNSKDAPSQRTAWMGERKPLFSLSRSQAVGMLANPGRAGEGARTVCFGDYLRDGVEPLVAGPDLQLDFDEENREGTADFELVLDSATRHHASRHDRLRGIPDQEPKFGLNPAQELYIDLLA